MASVLIALDGHIVDSLILSKVLDRIVARGVAYEVLVLRLGQAASDPSHAELRLTAGDPELLDNLLDELAEHGAVALAEPDLPPPPAEARWQPAPADGVFPDGFYATTNLETWVRLGGRWTPLDRVEMDCGVVLAGGRPSCTPLHRVRAGQPVLVGDEAVQVAPPPPAAAREAFGFMGAGVSAERPKEQSLAAAAEAIRQARQEGRRVLFVGGPAIIHTGAGPMLAALIRGGWIDVLFAGNALATHDIEQALYGTSLGLDLATGAPAPHGHQHHLRSINRIRALGGIAAAVHAGELTSGVMHACLTAGVEVVLAGSIRDDGPLPEVITDAMTAQDAMRRAVDGVGVALMVATTLHSVAAGNLLPASVATFCIDVDPETVIKLLDRGTHQAVGIVTDCRYALDSLAARLDRR